MKRKDRRREREIMYISDIPTSSFLMHFGIEYRSTSSAEHLVREMDSTGVDGALIVQVQSHTPLVFGSFSLAFTFIIIAV